MKAQNLLFVTAALLALPFAAKGTTVYSDNFSSDTSGYNTPSGYTEYGYGDQYSNNNYFSLPDYTYIGSLATSGIGSTSFTAGSTGLTTSSAVTYIVSEGYGPATYPNSGPQNVLGIDDTGILNSNVGSTFAANTIYTLTYDEASQLNYYPDFATGNPFGTMDVSLTANGTDIALSTQTFTTAADGIFYAGPTVTLNTALDPSVVGESIGVDLGFTNTADARKEVGYTAINLAATVASPEPSTYALMAVGLGALVVLARRKLAVR